MRFQPRDPRPLSSTYRGGRRPHARRPFLEDLEGRLLLAATFTQTNLVSDIPGMAITTDPNLLNPWGLAFNSNGAIWVANNQSGTATIYNDSGQPLGGPLVVSIPAPGGGQGSPPGRVFNAAPGFAVSSGGTPETSRFLFATEEGTIAGWNPSVDPTHAITAVDNSASGAVYKGL